MDVPGLAEGHDLLAGVGGVGPDEQLHVRPAAAEPGDDAFECPGHSPGRVGVAGAEDGREGVGSAEDVEREEAVVAVVAVEGPPLLAAVRLVVGAVDVEHEPGRGRAGPAVDEQLGEQVLKRRGFVADPVVLARLAFGGVLEPVQRALAGQRRAVPAAAPELAGQEAEHGVAAQVVVIVQVLVAEGEADDALGHQRPDGVLGEPRGRGGR